MEGKGKEEKGKEGQGRAGKEREGKGGLSGQLWKQLSVGYLLTEDGNWIVCSGVITWEMEGSR